MLSKNSSDDFKMVLGQDAAISSASLNFSRRDSVEMEAKPLTNPQQLDVCFSSGDSGSFGCSMSHHALITDKLPSIAIG